MTTPVGSWRDRTIHASWGGYGHLVRTLTPGGPSADFAARGYVVGALSPALVEAAVAMVRSSPQITMQPGDSLPGYRSMGKVYKVAGTLNAGHRYFRPEDRDHGPLVALLSALGTPVREAMGTEWRVVNTRILETLPNAAIMGPNTWHGDGFPPDLLKIMLYLSPAGPDCGTTEFQLDGSRTSLIEGPPGTWVLFRNSTLIHRGVPPRTGTRLAIEITLMPAWRRCTDSVFAGLNATYPEYPWSVTRLGKALSGAGTGAAPAVGPAVPAATDKATRAREKAARGAAKLAAGAAKQAQAEAELRRRRRRQRWLMALNRIVPPVAVNIGGGTEFVHFRWKNLEGSPGPANPSPFLFHPDCRFPLGDGAVRTVYTSHCLEHLDDATVDRVLREARRVLAPGGRLVVKLPDFDQALASWRAGDAAFFEHDRWGLRRLVSMWPRRGVADTMEARASMVFCGFWNDEYGDHFSERREHERAYHGPAAMSAEELAGLVAGAQSPHAVSVALRAHVVRTEPSYHFNHQNAWSRVELRASLAAAGFESVSFETGTVVSAAADIPGIEATREASMYCLAVPTP